MEPIKLRGFDLYKDYLDADAQRGMVDGVREVVRNAPLFQPDTPYGKPMSVQMSAAGRYGWFSDRTGYRYVEKHPSGRPWPAIPVDILTVWSEVTGAARAPECCLINYYADGARMGMHQDKDEANFDWPVVSISLGDAALFRIGNLKRGGKTESIWLESGDVVVMGGPARLRYHGIDRTRPGSSSLLSNGGRINLTLRIVT